MRRVASGWVPEAANVQVPAVPEVSTDDQPVRLEAVGEERRGGAAGRREGDARDVRGCDRHRPRGRREGAAALGRRHGVGAVREPRDREVARGVARRGLRPGRDRRARGAGVAGDRVGRPAERVRAGDGVAARGVAVDAEPPGGGGRVRGRAGLVARGGVRPADVGGGRRLGAGLRVDVDVAGGARRGERQVRGAGGDDDVVVLPGALGDALAGHGDAARQLQVAAGAGGGEVDAGDVGRGDRDGLAGGAERAAGLRGRHGVGAGGEAREGVVVRRVARRRGGPGRHGRARGAGAPGDAVRRRHGRRGEVDPGDVGAA